MTKKLLTIGVVVLFSQLTTVDLRAQAATEEKKKIEFADLTVKELQAALTKGKVTVIDVNGLSRYQAGHVPGAVHYGSLKKKGLAKVLPEDKSALIVAYCGGPG